MRTGRVEAVRRMGKAAKVGDNWKYVNPSGDPYRFSPPAELSYALSYLVPYLERIPEMRSIRIAWKQVPQ